MTDATGDVVRPEASDGKENVDTSPVEVPPALQQTIEASVLQVMTEQYSGQFPHPEHMERYAALYPDSPKIIFEQFAAQGQHRREMERMYQEGNERRAGRGQFLAFALVVIAFAVGLICALVQEATAASIIIPAAFTGGVVLYIAGGGAKNAVPARKAERNRRAQAKATRGDVTTTGPVETQDSSDQK